MRFADRVAERRPVARTQGFTLLEMAIVLVILGVLYAIWSSVVPWINEELRLERTRKTMEETQQAILAFARTNNRLPCPDTSLPPNGLEGSGGGSGCDPAPLDVVGLVPHQTLLLSAPVQDGHHVPITYSVYRNSGLGSDLAEIQNRIDTMNDVDGANVVTASENILDFCQALRSASATAGTGFTSTSTSITAGGCGSGTVNPAYALASSGKEDADGDTKLFDGDNAIPGLCFASPQQGRSATYDDVVTAVSFKTLIGLLCRTLA